MKRFLTILFLFLVIAASSQTTMYLEASGTPWGAGGTISTWTNSASVVRLPCYPTEAKQKTTIASTSITVDNSSSTATTVFAQFISPVLNAQTISGNVTAYARMSISNATGATVQSRIKITVIDKTGAVVATLLAMTSGAQNLTTTLTSYIVANAASLTSYSCAFGDRLCIEIGIGRSSGTTSRTGTISFGSSSATDISGSGFTNADNPTVIFSGNISFYKGVTF